MLLISLTDCTIKQKIAYLCAPTKCRDDSKVYAVANGSPKTMGATSGSQNCFIIILNTPHHIIF